MAGARSRTTTWHDPRDVMAGLETASNGEATLAPGATAGILLQLHA